MKKILAILLCAGLTFQMSCKEEESASISSADENYDQLEAEIQKISELYSPSLASQRAKGKWWRKIFLVGTDCAVGFLFNSASAGVAASTFAAKELWPDNSLSSITPSQVGFDYLYDFTYGVEEFDIREILGRALGPVYPIDDWTTPPTDSGGRQVGTSQSDFGGLCQQCSLVLSGRAGLI